MATLETCDSNKLQPVSSSQGAIEASARILLRRVFRILRGCGISEDCLREMATTAVDEIEKIPESSTSRLTARNAMMCCDVVLNWRRDPQFLDAAGSPAILDFVNPDSAFNRLVLATAGSEEPLAILHALEEFGVVRIFENGKVELISESIVACSGQDGNVVAGECVLEHICGFLGSVEFNVFDKPSREKGRFERACYASVPKELVPVLQQLVSSRGQEFVDVIDEWLSRRAIRGGSRVDSLLVGAGAYLFVRENF